jgi:hypothetical protein
MARAKLREPPNHAQPRATTRAKLTRLIEST